MTITTNIENKFNNIKKTHDKFVKANIDYLTEVFKFIFNNTEMGAFIWNQYTPYFCDGDECIFNVYLSTYVNKDIISNLTESSKYSIPDLIAKDPDLYEYELQNVIKDIRKVINIDEVNYNVNYFTTLIDEYLDNTENLLTTFGDHTSIIFYLEKNKVKFKQYDYTDHN